MKKLLTFICCAIVLCSCTGTSDNEIVAQQPLAKIYETAYTELSDENYEMAAQEFQKAETQYPSHKFAPDALVMSAYSYYLDNDFASAILAIDRYMRFHPGHQDAAYMMYLRGMCYYRQVSDVRREPGMSAYALQQFQALTKRFPRSPYAKNAENLMPYFYTLHFIQQCVFVRKCLGETKYAVCTNSTFQHHNG